MKYLNLLLLLVAGILLLAAGENNKEEAVTEEKIIAVAAIPPSTIRKGDKIEDGVSYINFETLNKWIGSENTPIIIDVLSPESYNEAHIKGAINIPLSELEKRLGELDKEKTIVVYCASYFCRASTEAAKILYKHRFKDVHDYKGGIKEWKSLTTGK